MQKIVTYLWFNDQAEDAMNFYVSLFPNSHIVNISRGPGGKVFTGSFVLDGQEFYALNGGPQFQFTEAVLLFINCAGQAEVDDLWGKLTADGGEESMCGWLKDRFGLSWQIIPQQLGQLMGDPDPARAGRVRQAMLHMRKIDVAALQRAHAGQ